MTDVQLPVLPGEVYVLAPHLPALAEEIVAAIAAEVPSYARPLARGSRAVRRGVDGALAEFVELSRDGGPAARRGRGGPGPARGACGPLAGRAAVAPTGPARASPGAALAALGLEAGLAPETLVLLAEAIFAYVDELSAESAEGFAREQAERAGELERRRRALAELLVATPAPDAGARRRGRRGRALAPARRASCVAVWREPHARPDASPRSPPTRCARRSKGSRARCSPGRRASCAPRSTGAPRGSGRPCRSPTRRGRSGSRARRWRSPRSAASRRRSPSTRTASSCCGGPSRRSSPSSRPSGWRRSSGETPNSRARLEATLLAWLRHAGTVADAAAELGVHPQTVRYRLGRLRELFGAALDEPDARFELELVLRAR